MEIYMCPTHTRTHTEKEYIYHIVGGKAWNQRTRKSEQCLEEKADWNRRAQKPEKEKYYV